MYSTMQLTTALGVFIVTFGVALPQEADIQDDYCSEEIMIGDGLLQVKMEVQASPANVLFLESMHSSSANRVAVAMPDQNLQFLEDESLEHGVGKTRAMNVSALMNKSCHPSQLIDQADVMKRAMLARNETLIQEYKRDGKILASGIPRLNFVHIPKTGGDSFLLAAAPLGQYAMAGWNWAVRAAGYAGVASQRPAIHMDPDIAKFIYGESTVFCAIRDPIERLWSVACMSSQYDFMNCSTPNECISSAIDSYNSGIISVAGWMWVPQVDYLKGKYGCTELLDFDNLNDEYNRVTKKHGFGDLRLPTPDETHVTYAACSAKCGNSSNMSPQSRVLIEAHLAKDIEFYKEFKSNRTRLNDSK